MMTVLVLEDERRVYDLIAAAISAQGYSFIDEPESNGLIKIIKKSNGLEKNNGKSFDLSNFILQQNSGELYKVTIEDLERSLISSVLERTEGNQLKASKILGINRNTLRTKIQKLGIDTEKWKVY